MNKEKIIKGFIWVTFIPLQIILGGLIGLFLQQIPIYWIFNEFFDLKDVNPLNTRIVSGPFGFLLVYLVFSITTTISAIISIGITSKPKLAWKILWAFQLIPLLILALVKLLTGINLFDDGNSWYSLAQATGFITAAIITGLIIKKGD